MLLPPTRRQSVDPTPSPNPGLGPDLAAGLEEKADDDDGSNNKRTNAKWDLSKILVLALSREKQPDF